MPSLLSDGICYKGDLLNENHYRKYLFSQKYSEKLKTLFVEQRVLDKTMNQYHLLFLGEHHKYYSIR